MNQKNRCKASTKSSSIRKKLDSRSHKIEHLDISIDDSQLSSIEASSSSILFPSHSVEDSTRKIPESKITPPAQPLNIKRKNPFSNNYYSSQQNSKIFNTIYKSTHPWEVELSGEQEEITAIDITNIVERFERETQGAYDSTHTIWNTLMTPYQKRVREKLKQIHLFVKDFRRKKFSKNQELVKYIISTLSDFVYHYEGLNEAVALLAIRRANATFQGI